MVVNKIHYGGTLVLCRFAIKVDHMVRVLINYVFFFNYSECYCPKRNRGEHLGNMLRVSLADRVNCDTTYSV